ncbi:MAG TPA: glucose-6-phosphate dehydrogenase assembly protein OpcA [Candidatus Limnocylindrales bacterium]|nr:glucose-6-phosphate dehydrogenase assembly protein OpcA [Candidatus Limnocylindrales bacterium]
MLTDANQPIAKPGQPVLRWNTRTHSIAGIEAELARIWSSVSLTTPSEDGDAERRVAPRSSVMNLVVIAGRAEIGERIAAVVEGLTGRHPSRTIVVSQADPDGPPWLDAQVQAHCMLPRDGAAETCAELVYLTAGGQTGQHLAGCVSPLLIHDLPVTIWWPGEPKLDSQQAGDLLDLADRVIVDGSAWSGDGLARLVAMSRLPRRFQIRVCDFAMLRQSRWREAIASTFDRPSLLPFLGGIRKVSVSYGAHDGTPGLTNVVKPIYHVAWLASRLRMTVADGLVPSREAWGAYTATLRQGRRRIDVALQAVQSTSPKGTTLAVRIEAERRRQRLVVDVTAHADGVIVRANADGRELAERQFFAPRRKESDLLAETIEGVGDDHISATALETAAALVEGRG